MATPRDPVSEGGKEFTGGRELRKGFHKSPQHHVAHIAHSTLRNYMDAGLRNLWQLADELTSTNPELRKADMEGTAELLAATALSQAFILNEIPRSIAGVEAHHAMLDYTGLGAERIADLVQASSGHMPVTLWELLLVLASINCELTLTVKKKTV